MPPGRQPLLPNDKTSGSANDSNLRPSWNEKSRTAVRFSDDAGSGYQELDVSVDAETRSLWCHMRPRRTPSVTPSMLYDLLDLHVEIAAGSFPAGAPGIPLKYYIQASRIPGIFNLGGDLEFIVECVRTGDRKSLLTYAHNCVQVVFNLGMGFDRDIVSVALVEGDALGGGFEGALGCNYIVAERRARFGFPEILFNCFPGMGAYSLLARRAGPALAEKMIQSAKIYTAAEMYEVGIVNQLADDSRGKEVLLDYIKAGSPSYAHRKAICKIRQCVNPIELNELRKITDIWVDMALQLSPSDLKKMQRFAAAQQRRRRNDSD